MRAEYPYIDESYKAYLLESYEDTYFPKSVLGAGKASYVKRNCEMIENSRFCIVYGYSENLLEWYAYMGENIRSAIYGKIHFNLTIPKFVSIIKITDFGMKQEILQ